MPDGLVSSSSNGIVTIDKFLNQVTPVKNPMGLLLQRSAEIVEPGPSSQDSKLDLLMDTSDSDLFTTFQSLNIQNTNSDAWSDVDSLAESKKESPVKRMPMKAKNKGTWPCEYCGKTMIYKNINRHVRAIHGEVQNDGARIIRRYVCNLCGIPSISRWNYERHHDENHIDEQMDFYIQKDKI